ncbi:hypothetical protein A5756_00755 [Mycobacterium sp. 852002-53434_SCH5985345]|uniref:hypothetical protein n=1 Tax=Mycobacterium sp. 852002-53434_SCH5985345 TaxID=1834107 RepID=UPI0007FDA115|nr:hypothetical protein [Mycobacterium sp. 852002-53434_SCH5985345]OBF55059.1 hypothetical protein A5756_00755 [Mycobacterium sp. 852002-53434_SCH5985345]
MTEYLPGDRLPDAPCLLPTEASAGYGYIAETGENAITLTLLDPTVGPVNIAMTPDLAMLVAGTLAASCVRLRRLAAPQEGGQQ